MSSDSFHIGRDSYLHVSEKLVKVMGLTHVVSFTVDIPGGFFMVRLAQILSLGIKKHWPPYAPVAQ